MSQHYRKVMGPKRTVLAAAVSIGVLVLLGVKIGFRFDHIAEQIRQARWGLMLAAFAFSAGWHLFVGADKWWRILRGLGADVPYWEVFRVRLGSDPIRFVIPFKAGEVVNAAYFARIPDFGFSRAAGSIAFDKGLNFFGTIFWLYVGIAAMSAAPPVGHLLMHTLVGAGVVALVAVKPLRDLMIAIAARMHPKLGRFATGVLSAFEEFSLIGKIGFLMYGIVFMLRPIVVCYLLFMAFNPVAIPTFQEFFAYGSVAVLMSNVPLTIAGIGPREAAIMELFKAYCSQATLLSVGILMSFSIHIIPAILGIPLAFSLLKAIARDLPTVAGQPGSDAQASGEGEAAEAAPPMAVSESVATGTKE